MQHTDSRTDCKPAAALSPTLPERWNVLTVRAMELAQRRLDTALPLEGPAPSDLVKAELLEQAADLVDLAKLAGEISLVLLGSRRPRALPPVPVDLERLVRVTLTKCVRKGCERDAGARSIYCAACELERKRQRGGRLAIALLAALLSSCGGAMVLPPPDDAGAAADVGRADAPTYGPACPFDTLVEAQMRDCGPLLSPWRCVTYYAPEGGCAWQGSPRFLVSSCDQCPWPSDAAAGAVR